MIVAINIENKSILAGIKEKCYGYNDKNSR